MDERKCGWIDEWMNADWKQRSRCASDECGSHGLNSKRVRSSTRGFFAPPLMPSHRCSVVA